MKYSGPVRFILKGNTDLAMKYTSRSRLLLQQAMDRMGPDKAYWTRTLPDGTKVTVSSLGGIKQVWISTIGAGIFKPCRSIGFLANVDSFGVGFLDHEDYSQIIQNSYVDDYVAGKQSWFSDQNYALTWDSYQFRYGTHEYSGSPNIYLGGCLYAVAPGEVTGIGVFENFLIAKVDRYFYYTTFRVNHYGTSDPGWTLLLDTGYILAKDRVAIANPSGDEWVISEYDPGSTSAGEVFFLHYSVSLEDGLPVMVLDSYEYGSMNQSNIIDSALGSYYREDNHQESHTDGFYNDNVLTYCGRIDMTLNPDADSTNCDTEPRSLNISMSGPTVCTGFEDPPSDVRRFYFTAVKGNYEGSALGSSVGMPDIPCFAHTSDSVQTINSGERGAFQQWGDGTPFVVCKDWDFNGEEVNLTLNPFIEYSASEEGLTLTESRSSVRTQSGVIDELGALNARMEEAYTNLQPTLSPPGFPCISYSGGGTYSVEVIDIHDIFEYPTAHIHGVADFVQNSIDKETSSTTASTSILFAGRTISVHNIAISEIFTDGYTYTRNTVEDRDLTYSSGNYYSWGEIGCSSVGGPPSGLTIKENTTYHIPTTVIQKTGTGRIIVDFDLRSGIILLLECSVVGDDTTAEGTSRLYWDTPFGSDIVVLSKPGIVMNPTTQKGYWQTSALPKTIIYPYAEVENSGPYTDFTVDKSYIIPNKDDTLLYVKGTMLGEDFEMMASVNTVAGSVISTVSVDKGNSINKLATL